LPARKPGRLRRVPILTCAAQRENCEGRATSNEVGALDQTLAHSGPRSEG
jgi:hypothetical protein